MVQKFYDRVNEKALLRHKYEKLESGEMIVLYGRRRVGKTELIKEFLKELPSGLKLYFYINLVGKNETLNALSLSIKEQSGETITFETFNDFLDYMVGKSKKEKVVLVLDEFQRFLDIAPEFITTLQDSWDSKLRHNRIMILLVGSSIGMIHKITESKAGALYGRVSRVKISPFRYCDFRLMFNDLSEIDKVIFYSVFGGTPFYLERAKRYTDVFKAINELVLTKGGELYEEPKNLLEYENVRIHVKYNSILHSIASGKEILKEINDFTKISVSAIPIYIKKLDELLDLVKRNDPVLGKERLGRYKIYDYFFRFWYKFIFPNQSVINLGNSKAVLDILKQDLNAYVGKIFEDIAKELLTVYINKTIKGIDINFEDIGSWWDRNANEIDIVAYNHKTKNIIVGDVKWTNSPVDIDLLYDLINKSKLINFKGTYQYLMISKNGFTDKCLAKMKELSVLHLNLNEMAKLFDNA